MKTLKHIVPVAVAIMLIAGLAQAGPNTRTLSVFPHVHKVQMVDVPVIEGVDEEQCIINVSKGECSASVDWDADMLNPLCHWQQDEFKCIKGHWECPNQSVACVSDCKPKDKKWVCDELVPATRKEWGIHCDEPLALADLFTDVDLDDEDIQCTPTTVDVECPTGSVQYDTTQVKVSYEELVTEAYVGDTVDVRGTIWTNKNRYVGHRFLVWKVYPNAPAKLLYKTGMRMGYSGGAEEDEIFHICASPGIIRFELRVFKPDGTVGSVRSKIVVKERPVD